MMPKEIQKPPYEESAVAPKVFPTAISLEIRRQHTCLAGTSLALSDGNMHLPHASKQLYQSTIAKSNADHEVRRTQASCPHIDQAQDEGGQRESAQTQWCGIGNAAVLDLFVETRLEFTTEGRQTLVAAGGILMSKRSITETGSGFGGLVFLVGHFTLHAGTVGLFVVVALGIAGMVDVGGGGHCVYREGREVDCKDSGTCFNCR